MILSSVFGGARAGVLCAVLSLLAGDIYGKTPIRASLTLFKALYFAASLAALPSSWRACWAGAAAGAAAAGAAACATGTAAASGTGGNVSASTYTV